MDSVVIMDILGDLAIVYRLELEDRVFLFIDCGHEDVSRMITIEEVEHIAATTVALGVL